jgi:hypothetical protein
MREHGVPMTWWSQQPRVVAKTGWVLCAPGLPEDVRVNKLIEANALGIEIVLGAGNLS